MTHRPLSHSDLLGIVDRSLRSLRLSADSPHDAELLAYIRDDYAWNNLCARELLSNKSLRRRYVSIGAQVGSLVRHELHTTLEQPVVLVDMDNVLVDYEPTTEARFAAEYPDIVMPNSSIHPYLEERFSDPDARCKAIQLQSRMGHFATIPMIDGASEGWCRIERAGFHPVVCTAPFTPNPWCVREKRQSLAEHLGLTIAFEAIIDPNKHLYDGVALIDDAPTPRQSEDATWSHVVFDCEYNHHSTSPYRLKGWRDGSLEPILAACYETYSKNVS